MLDGVRVLDLTQYLSGPSCTLLMAGLGADVIKVEPGPSGDAARSLPIIKGDHSSYFAQQNRGKRSVCVDLNEPEGHELVAALAGQCDVLVENFGYGVLEKRGLGPDQLRAANSALIYASISTFGRTGSKAHLPGFDLIAQAYAGSAALTGERDGAPLGSAAPMGDVGAGMMAFGAISAALYGRVSTGEGQFIDISMVESIFNMHPFAIQGPSQTNGKARLKRTGRHFGAVPPAGTFQGPDGWLAIHVLAGQWSRLCDAAKSIDLAGIDKFQTPQGRAEHRIELLETLESWMQTFSSNDELVAHLESHRVPVAPVVDPADAHLNDWFVERGAVTEIHDPHLGSIRVPGFPIHASGVPRREVEPLAPELGADNAAVLTELLGYDQSQIDSLTDSGLLISNR